MLGESPSGAPSGGGWYEGGLPEEPTAAPCQTTLSLKDEFLVEGDALKEATATTVRPRCDKEIKIDDSGTYVRTSSLYTLEYAGARMRARGRSRGRVCLRELRAMASPQCRATHRHRATAPTIFRE